ncbi:immunoglobulin superfamily member 10-like isoform X2 [Dendronephthya gigantea]|uniref:immunoglobulin superfamily member 10-like isoform X2 n=1 Tax=Dendronephthya gigantea TaxID=151771 RepID=UPI00106C281F|nr:immunoglobulin superfamily member 10-like isoform X2 [Dendronephthya gigantea]
MTCYGILIFFALNFLSFLCEGKINLPPSGNTSIVLPGSTVSINWTFTDDPKKSTLEWHFKPGDGSPLQHLATKYPVGEAQLQSSSLTRVTVEDLGTLVLTNVDKNYNGTYKFFLKLSGVVINPERSAVAVFIAERPTARLNHSSPVKLNQESNFACSCRAENGNPPASVTWYNEDEVQLVHGYDEQTLILKNVSGKDSGTYKCVARSHTLSNNKSIEVMVILNYKPNVTSVMFETEEAVLGKSFVVSCVSNGLPEPVFSIFHNGSQISSKMGSLRIPKVEWKHAGIYRCDARNKLGSYSGSANLTVAAKGTTTKPTNPSTTTATIGDNGTVKHEDDDNGLGGGVIAGITIGALALIVIIVVVVYYCWCAVGEKDGYRGKAGVNPGRNDNHYELEEENERNQYDTVGATSSRDAHQGRGKTKQENPAPVYAQVDKENRQGKPLYATLDTVALASGGSKKRDEGHPQPTEYAAIDHGRVAEIPRADLV